MAPYFSRTAVCTSLSAMSLHLYMRVGEYSGSVALACYICQGTYMDRALIDMEALLKAVADVTRLRILGLLLTGEVCVCHIHESLRIPQSKASRHLAYLRRAGLVATRREGLWVHYRLGDL